MMDRFEHWLEVVSKVYFVDRNLILSGSYYPLAKAARMMLYFLCIKDCIEGKIYWYVFKNAYFDPNFIKNPVNKKLVDWVFNLYYDSKQ